MEQNQTIASNHATFFRYAKLLLRFTHENPKGQKYLIGGIEKTVESYEATLLPKVRIILFIHRLILESHIYLNLKVNHVHFRCPTSSRSSLRRTF